MIKVNEYFDGKVKSLAHVLKGHPFSVGIMEVGEYTFGTSTEELMEVVNGEMEVILPDENEKKTYCKGDHFKVPANKEFKVTVTDPVSYICYYN